MKGFWCLWIGIVYIASMSVLTKLIYIIIIVPNENPANFFCCKTGQGDSKSHMEKPKAKNNKTKLEEKNNVVLLPLSDVKTL